jgi:ADP-ribosylglycohydrolase
VGIAVMAGRDTDCNAATVGSILGCALGTAGIPQHWTEPFQDRVRTELMGMPMLQITDLARRTLNVARKNCRHC